MKLISNLPHSYAPRSHTKPIKKDSWLTIETSLKTITTYDKGEEADRLHGVRWRRGPGSTGRLAIRAIGGEGDEPRLGQQQWGTGTVPKEEDHMKNCMSRS